MFQRELHQTVAALQVEFEADVLAMGFDRQRADAPDFQRGAITAVPDLCLTPALIVMKNQIPALIATPIAV